MKKMTMIAAALSLALMGTQAQAHDNSMCDYQSDYDLSIKDLGITFTDESNNTISIDQDNHLFIGGQQKPLNSEQQRLIDDYADGIREIIPEVTAIATEGVNLGVRAATMALGTLLGEDDPDFERFSYKINELAESITIKLDSNNFNSKELEEAFDEDFEQQIEEVVEQAVTEITPRLMAKIVTAAMSGEEGEIADIEARAEALEDDIENFVEPQAEALEARADELCSLVDSLNTLEGKMVGSGLEMMDLIDKGDGDHSDHKKKRFNFDLSD